MKNIIKYTLAVSAVALLGACGGGGGGSDTGGNASTSKYVGNYNYCDGDHTRFSV